MTDVIDLFAGAGGFSVARLAESYSCSNSASPFPSLNFDHALLCSKNAAVFTNSIAVIEILLDNFAKI